MLPGLALQHIYKLNMDGSNDSEGNRAQNPYTQHPTIDSDGLSWPSM